MFLFSGMFIVLLYALIGPILLIGLVGVGVFMRNRRLFQNRDKSEPYINSRTRRSDCNRPDADQYIESEFIDEESVDDQ